MGSEVFEFGAFRVNVVERRFRRDGEEIALAPKVFEVLVVLLRNAGRLVTYDELMDAVWPDTAVEDGNLRFCIHSLRKELGSDAIETVPKHGYRFKLSIETAPEQVLSENAKEVRPTHGPARPWLPRLAAFSAVAAGFVLLMMAVFAWSGRPAPKASFRSIAVTPFSVIGADPANEQAIQRGLTEAILFNLKKLRGLTIVETDGFEPVASAKQIGADSLITGSVRNENGRYRVSFEILRVADGASEAADSFVMDGGSGIEVESTAALRIGRRIDTALATLRDETLIPNGVLSDEARKDFLLAQRLPRENDLNRWPEAVQLMRKVVAAAPNWPLGHAKLAEALMLVDGPGSCSEARKVAAQALELDARSADAHVVLGSCDVEERNWSSAEDHLRRAITISPESSKAHVDLALLLAYQRRFAEAETHIKRALELEPLVPYFNVIACQLYYYDKKWSEALRYCQKADQIEPGYFLANKRTYWVYVMQNRWDKVREVTFGKRSDDEDLRDPLSRPLVQGDVRGYWEANLEDRLANKGKRPSPMAVASYYAMLGDAEKTLSLLERAVAENSDQVKFLYADPIWDSVRREPRYRQLVREIGLSVTADPDVPTRTVQ